MATLVPKLIVFYLMIIGAALASGFTRTKPGQWIMDPEERKAASLRPGNDYVWACYDEYFVIENRCYKFESQVASWAEAQLICQKEGGALASLETWKNFPLVLKHLSSNEKGQFWFSAAFLRGKWRWTKTGQPIKPHWFGEFSGSWYDDNCAYFDTVSNAFKNGDCRAYKKYVCERPTEKVFLNGKFSHADRRPPRGGQADKNQGDALPLSSNTGDEIHIETPRPPQSEGPLPSSSQDTLGSNGEIFPHGDLPHGGDDSRPGPYLKNEKRIVTPAEEKGEKDSSVQNDASGNVHSTTTTKVVDSCSPDYNLLAGKCFRFHDEKAEWVEAYHACSNEGSQLASIRTEKEFSEINSFLHRMSNIEYWLSGAYFEEGWVWATDREPMERQWFGRRPRRAAFMCSYVTSTDEGYFDGLCSKKFGYICERPSEKVEVNVDVPKGMSDDVNYINDERYYLEENTPTMKPTVSPINADVGNSSPTRVNEEKSVNTDILAVSSKPGAGFSEASAKTAFCPKEYRNYINGKCYKFAQNESNWVQAYHACIKDGGNLASARTKRELFNLLSAIQEKPGDEFWLSGSLIDGQWVWANDRLSMKMELFVENPPHYEGFYCASIASELEGYHEKLCNTKAKFICEMIPSSDNIGYSGKDGLLASDPSLGQEHEEYSQCPEKYNMAADISFGTCYRISSERLPWVNASNECRRDGGHLVTIKSEQEFAELLDVMKVNAFKSRHYWTAGKLSDWSWEDGDQINEDVVKINANMCGFIAHFKRKLRGGNCVFRKYFICQITLG